MNEERAYLLPPPRMHDLASATPGFGRLVLAHDPEDRVEEIEPFRLELDDPEPIPPGLIEKLSGHPKVLGHVGEVERRPRSWVHKRPDWEILGVRRANGPKEDEEPIARFVAYGYDYREGQAFVIKTDKDAVGVEVDSTDIELPPSPQESLYAQQRALQHPSIADIDRDALGLQVRTIPAAQQVGTDRHLHRPIEIVLVHPAERLARHRVIFDLVADECISVTASGCGCDDEGGTE